MTWGVFTSFLDATLCSESCPASTTSRMEIDLREPPLGNISTLGYQLTGIYLAPESILNPAKWASLFYNAASLRLSPQNLPSSQIM